MGYKDPIVKAAYEKAKRIKNRLIATEFVNAVNIATYCVHCGAQPIEWHREEHEQLSNARVSSLRTQGVSIARIQREMDLCTPLCRKCHMKEDGRAKALHLNAPHFSKRNRDSLGRFKNKERN